MLLRLQINHNFSNKLITLRCYNWLMLGLNKKRLGIKWMPLLGSSFLIIILVTSYLIFYHPSSVAADWYSSSWAYRKELSINDSEVSEINGTTLTDFPVLVSLTDPDLKSVNNNGYVALSNGNDIIFTASDGVTLLNYEIENYNPSTGSLQAWVNNPSLSPTANNIFYIYYGNASAPANTTANAQGTWNSNYGSVFHLDQNGNGSEGEYVDSTSNGNGMQGGGGTSSKVPAQTAGQIYDGQLFSGGQYTIKTNPSDLPAINASNQTISAWYEVTSTSNSSNNIVVLSNTSSGGNQLRFNSNDLGIFDWGGGEIIEAAQPTANSWHFVVWTHSGTTNDLYFDGVSQVTNTTALQSATTTSLELGSYNDTPSQAYVGSVDEVEILNTALSADWINTEYQNQSSPTSFITEGNQEQQVASSSPNEPPSSPNLIFPADGSTDVSVLPEFQLRTTDQNADYIDYNIQIFSGTSCGTLLTTANESSSTAGWLNEDANSSTAYNGGVGINDSSVATYQYGPTPLSPNVAYSWDARAIDPGGSDTYSSYSTCQSFTTTSSEVDIQGSTNINGGTTIN